MSDWNVIVNLHDRGFKKAFRELQGFGVVTKTDFLNVLTLKVSDIPHFLELFQSWLNQHPQLLQAIAHISPITDSFIFQDKTEFETKAKEIVLQWLPELANKSFYVRMHRRGFKGKISSSEVEHFLGRFLLEALQAAGTPAKISFDTPDVIIIVETLGQWAGLAYWQQETLQKYPWLRFN